MTRRTAFITTLTALLGIGKAADTSAASVATDQLATASLAPASGSLTAVTVANGAAGGSSLVPSDVKIDESATTFTVEFEQVTPGTKLFIDLEIEPIDPTSADFEQIAQGGFTVEQSAGTRTLTAGELFDDADLFLTNHSEIEAADFRVFDADAGAGDLPSDPVGSADKHVINGYRASVDLRTASDPLETGVTDNFQMQYAVFGGFGANFGYNFGSEQVKDFPQVSNVPDTDSGTVVEGGTVSVNVLNAAGGGTDFAPELFKIDSQVTEFIVSYEDLTPGELLFVRISLKPLYKEGATFEPIGEGGFSVTESTGSQFLDAEYLFDAEQKDMSNHGDIQLDDFRVFEGSLDEPSNIPNAYEQLQNRDLPSDHVAEFSSRSATGVVTNTLEVRVSLETATQTIGSQTAQFQVQYGVLGEGFGQKFGYNLGKDKPVEGFPTV